MQLLLANQFSIFIKISMQLRTKALLTVIFLSVFSMAYSQSSETPADLEWGQDYREPTNTFATKIIGLRSDGFYLLRQKVLNNPDARPRAWVELYGNDMKLNKSVEQELKYKGKQRDFEEVLYFGRKLYLLTSFNNTAKKMNFLFKQEISTKSLIPSKKLDMVCETTARNKSTEGTFDFRISKDSTHLLIYNDLPYKKDEPEQFGFRVFDQNFDLVWKKKIRLPFPDNQFTVEEYQVDEMGNVHLLGVLYTDAAKLRRRGTPTYEYVILSYLNNGETKEEMRINLDDKFVTDLTFRVAKDGDLICSGFYSDRGTYSIKGACYFRLDPKTRELITRNYQPFEFDFMTVRMSEKKKEKTKKAEIENNMNRTAELFDYSLDELILRSDGGAVLVAEQFYIEYDRYNNFNNGGFGFGGYGAYSPFYSNRFRNNYQTDYFYNYNDIIVVNIRPTGEIEWTARIPKRQETRNDGGYYSSYAMSIIRDKLYFIYNDNARNLTEHKKKSNRLYNYNGSDSIISLAQISIGGEVNIFPLAYNKDAGIMTRPKMCKQIGKKEMAVFGERGKNYRFGKLVFD